MSHPFEPGVRGTTSKVDAKRAARSRRKVRNAARVARRANRS